MPPAATTVPPAKPRGRPPKPKTEPGLGKGYAKVLQDQPAEPDIDQGAGETPPPRDPPPDVRVLRPRRPRPPRWMRIALYVAMLLIAFAVGWMIGQIWGEVDRRIWGYGD